MKSETQKGIILMNLGSPASTKRSDVKAYLDEFLMDGRVIDYPHLLRAILVKGIITPFRAHKSAEAYASIWTKDGSPLVHITHQLKAELATINKLPIEVAMRYGAPTMKMAYDNLLKANPGIQEVVLMPLYPHYAMSSYETAVEHAKTVHQEQKYPFAIKFVPPFYQEEAYIEALAASIQPYLKPETHLLFSYHSIPVRHIQKSDCTGSHCYKVENCCSVASTAHQFCYKHQCTVTTQLVAKHLKLSQDQYSIAFQSKLGRAEWLTPATTTRMNELPKEGIKNLLVVCPAFVSDCLETLEEIAIRERENFEAAGGTDYTFIPCMNTQMTWVKAMNSIIMNEFS